MCGLWLAAEPCQNTSGGTSYGFVDYDDDDNFSQGDIKPIGDCLLINKNYSST